MAGLVEDRLLALLACPECGGELGRGEDSLVCSSCGETYEVRGGIPLLIPAGIDQAHLAEEEKLGEIMTGRPEPGNETLSEQQWKLSKKEFWDFVRRRLAAPETPAPGGAGRDEPGGEATEAAGAGLDEPAGEVSEAGKTIVNIGCGLDTAFLELAGGNTAVAFDLTFPLLEKLRDEHGSRLNVAGAVEALPFRDGVFDAVCCVDLIHHEPDRLPEMFGSFARVLAPGGMLFLEDINARGLLQMWKSKMMPRRLHGALRELWHRARGSKVRPAPYEFPTDVFESMRGLEEAGFEDIEAMPLLSYPNTGRIGLSLYGKLSSSERIRRYHNFHYLLFARKPGRHRVE